jgi:hypothetical protein
MNKDHSPKPSFRQGLGLPVERGFLPGPSPCPVDIELIRALHDGKLSREVELEIRDLTLAYREWADASQAVLHAMTATRTTEPTIVRAIFWKLSKRIQRRQRRLTTSSGRPLIICEWT